MIKRLALLLLASSFAWSQQSVSLLTTQQVSIVAYPVSDASGTHSPATLAHFSTLNSNANVMSVTTDPANPAGVIITAVGPGKATLTVIAQATEPDGVTTEQVQGTVAVTVTLPVPVAKALMFTIGTPVPIGGG